MNIPHFYLKFIYKNPRSHAAERIPIIAMTYDFIRNKYKYYNFSHVDTQPTHSFKYFVKYIAKDKEFIVDNMKEYKYHITNRLYDINIIRFLNNMLDKHEITNTSTPAYKYNNGNIIPFAVYQREFKESVKRITSILLNKSYDYFAYMYYSAVSDSLYEIEKNGLCVDPNLLNKHFGITTQKNIIYSDYNTYTITGRPSNSFNNINFVALNKHTNCREAFISRYKNGKLILIDFKGYHPTIISKLINYTFPSNENIYEHLCKEYYNTTEITDEMIVKIKKLVMYYLYGNNTEDNNITFFKRVNELKKQYWNQFDANGYIETPTYKRKIKKNMVLDNNPGKLLSYILQASETEFNIPKINKCVSYCIGRNIKPILYIYDSILFDTDLVTPNLIKDLKDMLEDNLFKVRVYVGNNYNNMELYS